MLDALQISSLHELWRYTVEKNYAAAAPPPKLTNQSEQRLHVGQKLPTALFQHAGSLLISLCRGCN